jgi:YidC/Oxa1 family membrane protein insertase
MFTPFAWLIDTFYGWTNSYGVSIALVAFTIMVLIAPLTMKSTKGMLEMQRLQPEMKKLQNQYKSDRQRLNQEMMKLYSEHKVNPLASCLPLMAQMPVFIIMFRVLHGLTYEKVPGEGFTPKYIAADSALHKALSGATKMMSFGLDLHLSPKQAMQADFVTGLPYALMIVVLGGLFLIQQRMVASRTASPTMSAGQAKVMQYLPVAFAFFQVFLPTGLVVYYMVQAIFRILQQGYITRRFYGEDGLGKQAQEASAKARELGKDDSAKPSKQKDEQSQAPAPIQSKRVTPGKNRPAPSGRPARPVPPSKRNK